MCIFDFADSMIYMHQIYKQISVFIYHQSF